MASAGTRFFFLWSTEGQNAFCLDTNPKLLNLFFPFRKGKSLQRRGREKCLHATLRWSSQSGCQYCGTHDSGKYITGKMGKLGRHLPTLHVKYFAQPVKFNLSITQNCNRVNYLNNKKKKKKKRKEKEKETAKNFNYYK